MWRLLWTLVALVARGEVRLGYRIPRNGTSISGRLEPEIDLWVDDHRDFAAKYGDVARLCCAVDGKAIGCERLESTQLQAGELSVGPHVMTCSLVNILDGTQLLDPCCEARSEFRVVASAADTEDGQRLLELRRHEDARTETLLAWWQGGPPLDYFAEARRNPFDDPKIVLGVKCAAGNVVARDTMRRTWLALAPPSLVAKFAIGRSQHEEKIEREKQYFGDVLSTELDVDDGYLSLVAKTKAFLVYVVRHYPAAPYAMLCDDDVYVDAAALLSAELPQHRFYGGQVWAEHFGKARLPQRDAAHRNYLAEADYPMSELPPFAIGPHYILSKDCVNFVADNAHRLEGVGTLEDVSMAMWMFAIGVKPQHTDQFANARLFGCVPNAVSLADLTPAGILALHQNRLQDRNHCEGFDALEWVKTPRFRFKS